MNECSHIKEQHFIGLSAKGLRLRGKKNPCKAIKLQTTLFVLSHKSEDGSKITFHHLK